MSEISALRQMITEIHTTSVQTARDVTWIKEGMERGARRMDGHDQAIAAMKTDHAQEIAALKTRNARADGKSSIIGTLTGMVGSAIAMTIAGLLGGHH